MLDEAFGVHTTQVTVPKQYTVDSKKSGEEGVAGVNVTLKMTNDNDHLFKEIRDVSLPKIG
jgi:hypothetical protein